MNIEINIPKPKEIRSSKSARDTGQAPSRDTGQVTLGEIQVHELCVRDTG